MLPFISVFGKQIPMYGIAALSGVAFAVLYLKLCEKSASVSEADLELAFLYALIGAAVGAKLLYLMVSWRDLSVDLPYLSRFPVAFIEKYLYGGFVFYGGLFGALFAAWLYCKLCCIDYFEIIQIALPAFPLIHAFGRIGCFCAGCCYGVSTGAFFGVTFRHSPFAPNGIPLVPVQLMEASVEFLLLFLLANASFRKKSGKCMLGAYMIAYGVLRFVLEFFRGDPYRGFIGTLSVSQCISALCVITGALLATHQSETTPPTV